MDNKPYNKKMDNLGKYIIHTMLMEEERTDYLETIKRRGITPKRTNRGKTVQEKVCIDCKEELGFSPPRTLRCKKCGHLRKLEMTKLSKLRGEK